MSKKIQVILLEDIMGLGLSGDIVSVSEGHARNSLFGSGKAALADATTKANVKRKQDADLAANAKKLEKLQATAEKLDGTELIIKSRSKEEEGSQLYGSVTSKNIAEELKAQADIKIMAKDVMLKKPILQLGSQDVTIKLSSDVEANIRVTVINDEKSFTQ